MNKTYGPELPDLRTARQNWIDAASRTSMDADSFVRTLGEWAFKNMEASVKAERSAWQVYMRAGR